MFVFNQSLCVEPRDYQAALFATAKRSFAAGQRDLIQIATGGGKTLVLTDFAWWNAKNNRKVLIVTKDWELLHQAAQDLCARHRHALDQCGFVGSSPLAKQLFRGMTHTPRAKIIFTTIQSWNRRRDGWPIPDVILIDELHWGEGAPLYTRLLEKYDRAYILGFTATPRSWTDFRRIGRPYTFQKLIEKDVLAKPIVEDVVQTGVSWNPERTGTHGDITQTSLRELADNHARNDVIVQRYLTKKDKYKKTLVFACNIKHAERLETLFKRHNVRVGCVHHRLSHTERESIIGKFRGNELDVLVNVTMLTHGVNIPDIQTVFLTRPTFSDILFQQMIGRGSRRTPTKRTYYLVDFVDAIDTYGVPPLRADGFFGSAPVRPGARGIAREEHEFEQSSFIPMPLVEGYRIIEGLDIAENQTFGIEFELGTVNQDNRYLEEKAEQLLSLLREASIPTAERRSWRTTADYRVWNVVRDSSCGLEIVSRILKGPEGFVEVMDMTRKLRPLLADLDLKLDSRTGTHVHLGWTLHSRAANRLLDIVAYYEPALMSLVPPSRHENQYARSIRSLTNRHWRMATKYCLVNLMHLEGAKKTVEARLHSGTMNGAKILTWISLWMRILAKAQHYRASIPEVPAVNGHRFSTGPDSSVKELASFVEASETLRLRLMMRRWELAEKHWSTEPAFTGWLEELRRESTNDSVLRLVRDTLNAS